MSADVTQSELRTTGPEQEISEQEKAASVALALASRTLARSELLRNFLRYVSEMALSGRIDQITEHLIGVRALGRPERFSPGEDSSVRNRARGLRLKLEEFYREERPDLEIRIEIPAGSYCPAFRRVRSTDPVQPAPPDPVMASPVAARRRTGVLILAGFAAGVLATGALVWLARDAPARDPVLDRFWGPLLQKDTDVTITVASPPQLFVRSFPKDAPPRRRLFDMPRELYSWYSSGKALPATVELGIQPTHNSPLWGDSCAAVVTAGFLARAGVPVHLRPERIVAFPAFRGRNCVVLGTPEYSPAAQKFLERGNFTLEYSRDAADYVVVNRKPAGQEPAYYAPRRNAEQQIVEVYAVITVLPSDGSPDGRHRTIVISGLNSAGTEAAAEYITSPPYLVDLEHRLGRSSLHPGPGAYQVVIKSTTDDTLPLTISYVTHRVTGP